MGCHVVPRMTVRPVFSRIIFNLKHLSPLSNHTDQFGFEKYALGVSPTPAPRGAAGRRVAPWRRTRPPTPLPFLLWFVVITKIYACCSTNLLCHDEFVCTVWRWGRHRVILEVTLREGAPRHSEPRAASPEPPLGGEPG